MQTHRQGRGFFGQFHLKLQQSVPPKLWEMVYPDIDIWIRHFLKIHSNQSISGHN